MKVDGIERVQAYFKTRQHRFQNPKPFFERCVTILSNSASKTWNTRGRPKWAPRKDDKSHPLMEKTGRLRRSMEATTASGDAIVKMSLSSGDAWLEKGTSVDYAKYHQITGVGEAKTKRQFVQIHDEDVKAIEHAEDYFFKD